MLPRDAPAWDWKVVSQEVMKRQPQPVLLVLNSSSQGINSSD